MIATKSSSHAPPLGAPHGRSPAATSGAGPDVSSAHRLAGFGAVSGALDTAIFWLWLTATLLAPVWFGSNLPLVWGIHAAIFGSLLAAYGAVAVIRRAPLLLPLARLGWPLAALAVVLLWAAIQTSSLVPSAWQHPIWQRTRTALGEDVAGSISVYPAAGWMAILWTATVAANFVLAVQFSSRAGRAWVIDFAVAASAGAIATYGLVIYYLGNHWVLWSPKHAYFNALTATFIGRNTFAAYAGAALVCTVGLLLESRRHLVTRRAPAVILLGAIALALCAALLLTGSRAGAIVSGVGVAVLLVLRLPQLWNHWKTTLAGLMFGILAIAGLVVVGGHLLVERFANFDSDFAYRLAVDARVLAAIRESPWLGYGYGAFERTFTMFRDWTLEPHAVWEYGHNDWLEALLTLGIPVGLLLWFIFGWILVHCLKAACSRGETAIYAAIATGTCTLSLLHSTVDFSIQIQGFALPLTTLLGVGVAQSLASRR
jgi:O-antigen ligase